MSGDASTPEQDQTVEAIETPVTPIPQQSAGPS